MQGAIQFSRYYKGFRNPLNHDRVDTDSFGSSQLCESRCLGFCTLKISQLSESVKYFFQVFSNSFDCELFKVQDPRGLLSLSLGDGPILAHRFLSVKLFFQVFSDSFYLFIWELFWEKARMSVNPCFWSLNNVKIIWKIVFISFYRLYFFIFCLYNVYSTCLCRCKLANIAQSCVIGLSQTQKKDSLKLQKNIFCAYQDDRVFQKLVSWSYDHVKYLLDYVIGF